MASSARKPSLFEATSRLEFQTNFFSSPAVQRRPPQSSGPAPPAFAPLQLDPLLAAMGNVPSAEAGGLRTELSAAGSDLSRQVAVLHKVVDFLRKELDDVSGRC